MSARQLAAVAVGTLTVLVSATIAWQLPEGKPAADAHLVHPAQPVGPFILTHVDTGQTATQADLDGRWTLISTGFTNCPQVCPTTTANVRQVLALLPPATASVVAHWFVSVDPARDTADAIADFLANFGPAQTRPLGGTEQQLREFSHAVKFMTPRQALHTAGIAHSGSIALIDPRGRLRALFRYPHSPETMAATLIDLIHSGDPA